MIPQLTNGQLIEARKRAEAHLEKVEARLEKAEARCEDLLAELKEAQRKIRNQQARLLTSSKRLETAGEEAKKLRLAVEEEKALRAKAENYAAQLRGRCPENSYIATLTPKERSIRWGTPEGKRRLEAAVAEIVEFTEAHGYAPGNKPNVHEVGDFSYVPQDNEESK